MRLLHCSDLHLTHDYFSTPLRELGWRRSVALLELKFGGRARSYAGAAPTLAQILLDLGRHQAEHLLISGDLTAYAMESEFRAAREALSPLCGEKRNCTVVPGNHDLYTPEVKTSGLFERYFGPLLQSDLPSYCREGPYPFVRLLGEEAAVIGLCSARVPPLPGLSCGFIGRRQLQGLEELLVDSSLAHRAVLVAVHHAPLSRSGKRDRLHHGLLDARALFRLVRGPRFAVLHGHIHQRYYHPATATRPHLFGAGSSTSRGKEGYWLLEVEDGRVRRAAICAPGAEEIPWIAAGG